MFHHTQHQFLHRFHLTRLFFNHELKILNFGILSLLKGAWISGLPFLFMIRRQKTFLEPLVLQDFSQMGVERLDGLVVFGFGNTFPHLSGWVCFSGVEGRDP